MLKKLPVLFLLFVFLAVSCPAPTPEPNPVNPPEITEPDPDPVYLEDLDWGTRRFYPDWLVLTPGNDTTELMLNWHSETGSTPAVAKVRFYGGEYDFQELTGTAQPNTSPPAYRAFSLNRVTVTGLKADTEYKYWVSSDGVNWSDRDGYTYKSPKTDSFRFAAISDPQLAAGNNEGTYPAGMLTRLVWLETMQKIGQANVNFIASSGDQIDDTIAGSQNQYEWFFTPPALRSLPYAPTVGNHDRHYNFRLHYNMPNELTFEPLMGSEYGNVNNEQYAEIESVAHYWYRYNNALFVVLNSSAAPANTDAAVPYIERFEQTLTAAKAASPGYTWLFVQHHKSTTCVGEHCGDGDVYRYVYAGFEELMSDHGVDFVLAGHDHGYTRSYPMTGKKGGTPSVPDRTQNGSVINNPNGVLYFTLPTTTGVKYYNTFTTTSQIYPFLADGTAGQANLSASNKPIANNIYNYAKIPGYMIVDVEGNQVSFNFYQINDTTTPVDSFVVTK